MVQEIGASLPDFIYQKMVDLDMRPSYRKLAEKSGVNFMTLQQNLTGTAEMKLSNAKRVADAINCTVDELLEHVPELAK